MKVLKIIGLVIIGIIALALVTGLFVNGEYALERELTINKSKQEVFDYVKYLKNQANYSVWATMDPTLKKEFRGEDASVGFVYAWDSKNPEVGKGEQKIIGIDDGVRIDYELHFLEPFESTDYAYMSVDAVNDSVSNVKWGFKGKMKYPMNLIMLTMHMEKMLAPDLENGLNNLKELLETKE